MKPESLGRICLHCGGRVGDDPVYKAAAQRMGQEIARRGTTLVYGGGTIGLMGAAADGALKAGGRVIGIMASLTAESEHPHPKLQKLEVLETQQERKRRMVEISDACVALPGGFGVVEELFEAVTWRQLGYHHKPCGLLNTRGYFDDLLRYLEKAEHEGFLREEHRRLVIVASEPEALLDALCAAARA